ncbi:MAG: ABC transporter substrate-binding protein [Eubacterium sp.]|nr:ABC transporter substrate-binding protein [Eubacterium sp.]
MKKKTILALLLAGVMAVSMLSGCSGSGSGGSGGGSTEASSESGGKTSGLTRPTTKGKEENALYLSIVQAPNTLDPAHFALQAEDWILMQIYEPLFFEDNDGNPVYVLIDDMVVAEDDSKVEFTLKEGVKFHSGDVLTASDVAYSLARSENSTLLAAVWPYIECEVIDDTHFNFNFPYADQGAGFSAVAPYMAGFCIVNESYCEGVLADKNDDLKFNCDGTGAYKFESMSSTGDTVLTRFEDYYGEASIDTLYFSVITGNQELAFEAGDIDYAMYTGSTYKVIKEYDNVYAYAQPVNGVIFLVTNMTENAVTHDPNVREAIVHLLNKEDITIAATDDSGTPADNLASQMVQYWEDCCTHFELDVNKANELMSAAGYSESKKAELTLIVMSAYPAWVSACSIVKENLEQSYFTVNIEEVADTSRYFTQDFDLAFISIGLTTSFTSYSMIFDSTTGMNLSGVSEEDAKPVLDAFAAIKDEETTHEAMKAVVDSMIYIPLSYMNTFLAYDGDLNTAPFYTASGIVFYREFSW